MSLSKVILDLVCCNLLPLILFLAITFLVHTWLKESRKLPPGPIGLPLVGYLPFFGKEPHKVFLELGKRYGNIISLRMGRSLAVVLNEYKVLKEVLNHNAALNRHPEFFNHVPERGFFSANGEAWNEQRRFCVQSTKELGLNSRRWEKMVEDEVSTFLEDLGSKRGQPVDVADELSSSTCNNIIALLIGRRLDRVTEADKIDLFVDFMNQSMINIGLSNPVSLFPRLRKVFEYLKIGDYHIVAKTISSVRNFVTKELEKHEKNIDEVDSVDFIDLYMRKTKEISEQQGMHFFSEFNLRGNINVLFLGGSDTVATSLEYAIRYMAGHPDIQKKVHDELDDVLGRDGKISYNERFKLPFTLAVLMECLRCSSIVPLNPNRWATADIEVNGYTIPKGTQLIGNLWALHRDPEYWDEPERFKPERFLTEDKTQVIKNPQSFVPFSIGRRNCPGEKVAYTELLLFFTSIMQRFHIVPPPGEEVHYEVYNGLVAHLKPQSLCFIDRAEEVSKSVS